ncbi:MULTISPECIES: Cmx/CmrA family chloramphenicol efflux MFS transporter [Streptomyces]|uniref:Cmx/CmrA family chloramphenicol efflux MFS transporter n=2 Tax=Streptomyces TaxID=1883 RepID=A0ABU4K8S1_9ACTN|nr:Cmx/CmrA family chloramphenicol efflux MFS transporter [Streptomyces roseolus]MDX2294128.1 Cmx/CmrA family chloramphenicol efflux MFS transporter [Streptomyces roseolus]
MPLPPARLLPLPLPLYLLALAVFAMGTSEFMLAGLLPDLARDLGVSVGAAGALTSAFAVGMVIGAPLMAVLARGWSGRAGLLGFVLVFLAAHVVGAVTTSFPVLLLSRFVAALANAGFLALALTSATAMVAADRKARALAVLLGGTTVATVAGVPGGALLGSLAGWRAAFWAVAALCVPAALGVLWGVPGGGRGERTSLRGEFRVLRAPRLVRVMVLAALVNAATFGAFTFLAPVVTGPAGLSAPWVSVALVLFGAGSFAGVTLAGRFADRHADRLLAVGGPLLLVGWLALAALADRPAALLALLLVQGALSFALGGTLIARILYEATGAPALAGAYATAALNVGAVAGPLLAAPVLVRPTGPFLLSAGLVAAALAVGVVSGSRPGGPASRC